LLLLAVLVEPELLDVRERAVRGFSMLGSLLCEAELLWARPVSWIWSL
jgi:hypothetical protein